MRLIDMDAAVDALRAMQTYKMFAGDDMLLIDQAEAQTELMMLPSAQPEREKGEWVYNSPVTMKCNRCGLVIKDWDWHRFKICPNCGADMRRGEKDGWINQQTGNL